MLNYVIKKTPRKLSFNQGLGYEFFLVEAESDLPELPSLEVATSSKVISQIN